MYAATADFSAEKTGDFIRTGKKQGLKGMGKRP
jgi:hypothetical protein